MEILRQDPDTVRAIGPWTPHFGQRPRPRLAAERSDHFQTSVQRSTFNVQHLLQRVSENPLPFLWCQVSLSILPLVFLRYRSTFTELLPPSPPSFAASIQPVGSWGL